MNLTRLLAAYIRWPLAAAGYRIRPYDMLADRRRWFWQPRQRCGLPPADVDAIVEAIRRHQAENPDWKPSNPHWEASP